MGLLVPDAVPDVARLDRVGEAAEAVAQLGERLVEAPVEGFPARATGHGATPRSRTSSGKELYRTVPRVARARHFLSYRTTLGAAKPRRAPGRVLLEPDQETPMRTRLIAPLAVLFLVLAGAATAAAAAGVFESNDSGLDSPHDLAERGTGVTTPTGATTPTISLPERLAARDVAANGRPRAPMTQTTVAIPAGATQTFAAGNAGSVTIRRDGASAHRAVGERERRLRQRSRAGHRRRGRGAVRQRLRARGLQRRARRRCGAGTGAGERRRRGQPGHHAHDHAHDHVVHPAGQRRQRRQLGSGQRPRG